MSSLPLFHVGVVQPMAWLMKCATIIILKDWDHKEFCRLVQEEKVTTIVLAPALIHFVVTWPEMNKYDLSSLKLILYCAAGIGAGVALHLAEAGAGVLYASLGGDWRVSLKRFGPDDIAVRP